MIEKMSETQEEISRVIEAVTSITEPLLSEHELELVDVEYRKEQSGWVLRLFIDKKEGINLDFCASISRELSDLLDVNDPIHHAYNLEVSSPGLNRALKKEKDFERFKGRKIRIKARQPIGNRRNFVGILSDFKDGVIYMMDDDEMFTFPLKDIQSANLEWEC